MLNTILIQSHVGEKGTESVQTESGQTISGKTIFREDRVRTDPVRADRFQGDQNPGSSILVRPRISTTVTCSFGFTVSCPYLGLPSYLT